MPKNATGTPSDAFTAQRPVKIPRDRIAVLRVKADPCMQVLLRILDLLARQGIRPLSIAANLGADRQDVTIEINVLPGGKAKSLLARIEEIIAVREASFGRHHPQALLTVRGAKAGN
ncbi:hypothetical protein VVT58_16665 (plasmid) [Sphingobium sp. SJ10-10]|uniref:hypothetical protein n=1 Tax=Sphingobium sp. SJ10-10 TaxID=3114999 RepID=UPI002E18B554|nr:hypothetical protein [Sphingobium sp. SJ10-10]